MRDIFELLSAELEKISQYAEAIEIIKANSQDNFWLIGGMVYRTLANMLYGVERPDVDLDFIVDSPNDELVVPDGWQIERNSFGTYKFVGPAGRSIDFVPLAKVYSIELRNLEPTIDNFLTGVPLTVQSIVFEPEQCQVVGNMGIAALLSQTVKVISVPLLRYAAKQKDLKPEEYARRIATELGFSLILPSELSAD